MSDLVKILRNTPHPKSVHDMRNWKSWADCLNQSSVAAEYAADRIEALEAENAKQREAIQAAMSALSDEARKRGEAEGRLAASEWAGIVSGWMERAATLEAENARLRAQLKPRFDEYGHYAENNPPVGAQRLQGRATAHTPDLPVSGAKIGRNGQGKG